MPCFMQATSGTDVVFNSCSRSAMLGFPVSLAKFSLWSIGGAFLFPVQFDRSTVSDGTTTRVARKYSCIFPPNMTYPNTKCAAFWEYFIWVIRLWGLLTAMGLWAVGVEAVYYHHIFGAYLITIAALLTFLETVFLISIFIALCVRDEQRCILNAWKCVLWLDNWKKGLFYMCLGIPCFLKPTEVWMAIICGVMLEVSSLFYFLKTYKARQDEHLQEMLQTDNYDRVEEMPDDLDSLDDLEDEPRSIVNNRHQLTLIEDDTLADQQEILEV